MVFPVLTEGDNELRTILLILQTNWTSHNMNNGAIFPFSVVWKQGRHPVEFHMYLLIIWIITSFAMKAGSNRENDFHSPESIALWFLSVLLLDCLSTFTRLAR